MIEEDVQKVTDGNPKPIGVANVRSFPPTLGSSFIYWCVQSSCLHVVGAVRFIEYNSGLGIML